MEVNWKRNNRKWHRWGAILTALPMLIVIVSGLLLQVKKQVSWVQPPTAKLGAIEPGADWTSILESAKGVPDAQVSGWEDIDRLDVRPSKGIVKIQCKNRWELQLNLETAEVVASNYRRSDLIESLHDGSFFSDAAKLWLFLPNGLVLLGLWCTGLYLWFLPMLVRRKKQKEKAEKEK